MSSPVPAALPTAELHLHIEGTLEPELAVELARRNRVRLRHPDLASLRRAYSFSDLPSFLDLYYELTEVLQQPQDFTDLAEAYLTRAAAQGATAPPRRAGTATGLAIYCILNQWLDNTHLFSLLVSVHKEFRVA